MDTHRAQPLHARLATIAPPAATKGSGRYVFVRQLASSATSEVSLAVACGPLDFQRTVVLKRVPLGAFDDDWSASSCARLRREAVAYARLSHPAVVRLYDFIEDDDGRCTLVMEHVEGPTLARLMDSLIANRHALDDRSICYVGYRIFQALSAAHSARDPVTREFAPVIHRGVCPANVLVPWDGYVKLADFGIARLAGISGGTLPGVVQGIVGYLAPEQARGETATVRTDVYAACLVMHDLFLGEPAFTADSRGDPRVRAMGGPRLSALANLSSALPPRLANALDRGLASDPEQRSLTADEMVTLLRELLGDLDAARKCLVASLERLRLRSPHGQDLERAPHVEPQLADGSLFADDPPSLDDTTAKHSLAPRPLPQEKITSRPPTPFGLTPAPAVPPHQASSSSYPPPLASTRVRRAAVSGGGIAPSGAAARPFADLRQATVVDPVFGPFGTPPAIAARPLPWYLTEPQSDEEPPPSARSPWRRRVMIIGAALFGMCVAGGAFLAFRHRAGAGVSGRRSDVTSAPSSAPSPVAATPPPVASASAGAAAKESPAEPPHPTEPGAVVPVPSVAPTTGALVTDPAEVGHRIFVDGRFAGPAGAALTVRCGWHDVRVGSTGSLRHVEVPCGGAATVAR